MQVLLVPEFGLGNGRCVRTRDTLGCPMLPTPIRLWRLTALHRQPSDALHGGVLSSGVRGVSAFNSALLQYRIAYYGPDRLHLVDLT